MADEKKEKKEGTEEKLSFKTADELTNFLLDMQGQIANMQETIDKLSPVENNSEEGEEGEEGETEELSDEEINEIDRLLQSE